MNLLSSSPGEFVMSSQCISLTLSASDLGKIPYPSVSCKGRQPARLLRAYNGEPASVPRGLKLQPMQKTRVSAAGFGVTKAEPVWPATAGMRLKGLRRVQPHFGRNGASEWKIYYFLCDFSVHN